MRCSGCGTENTATAKFCGECGSRLHAPPVEAPAAPGPLLPTIEGEKRLVTLLFADMSSSVETTRDLEPEDAVAVINELLRVMVDAVLEHGGRVDHFLGDGILGVFGTPRAHETDPERAILAGLHIRDAVRSLGREVTIGINTGEVYVGRIGSERHGETTVMGAAVSLASRLQGQALPGEVLVGEATHRQTARAFRFTPRQVEVKGLALPLRAYVVEEPLAHPEKVRGLDGVSTGLIGREEELAALQRAARELVNGRGQVLCLVGDAGVGKSRLLTEARESTRSLAAPGGEGVLWLEGRCLELAMSAGYWPFVDILRQLFQWRPEEGESARGARILEVLAELVRAGLLPEERGRDLAPFLGNLLSVQLGPQSRQRLEALSSSQLRSQTFLAIRDLFVALARRQPLVLALEDLHWADSLSLDLACFLMESLSSTPIMLLCAYRPQEEPLCRQLARTGEAECGDRYTELVLKELSPDDSRRLLDSLLAQEALYPGLRDLVLEKSRGNPFFLEEVVRSLLDRGAGAPGTAAGRAGDGLDTLAVPETIQSVILSRVDRLEPPLKRVIQHASVAGQVFRPRVLQSLGHGEEELRQALGTLEERGLIYAERASPEPQYSFKHVLTRETVYETLLRGPRADLHGKVAEALETLFAGRLEECYEELAQHYSLSERHGRALQYLLKAGHKARRQYANQEAVRYFEQAYELLARLPPDRRAPAEELEALEGMGGTLFRMGAHRDAEVRFRQALSIPAVREEPRRVAGLTWKLADAVHWQGQTKHAIRIAEEGLAVLGEERCNPEAVNLLEVIMRSCWAEHDMEGARRHGRALEELLPRVPYFDSLYMIYYALAWLEIRSGEHGKGERWLEAMERVCVEHENENGLARCYHGLGDLWRGKGDYGRASEWFRKSLEYCERTRDAHLLLEGYIELAHALLHLDAPAAEIEGHIRRGMRIAEEMAAAGGVSSMPALCVALGDVYAQRGDRETAITYYRRSFDWGRPPSVEKVLAKLERLYADAGQDEEYARFRRTIDAEPAPT